jgi:hypothetical protein
MKTSALVISVLALVVIVIAPLVQLNDNWHALLTPIKMKIKTQKIVFFSYGLRDE